jgi:hypothetical protein
MKNKLSNSSYEEYLKDQLMILSSNFSIKAYKRANEEDWRGFEKGKDFRIQIQWKKDCIWEWITERSLWIQRNTNKEDRLWMRRHADIKLHACKNALCLNRQNSTLEYYLIILSVKEQSYHILPYF